MSVETKSLDTLLPQSAAEDEFKAAVRQLPQGGSSPRIVFSRGLPVVKILRVISKLLEEEPGLVVRDVQVDGRSGCSDFVGTMKVNGGEHEYRFEWDCRWRAEQEGLQTHWGDPDQSRAAQLFAYQCFRSFEKVS